MSLPAWIGVGRTRGVGCFESHEVALAAAHFGATWRARGSDQGDAPRYAAVTMIGLCLHRLVRASDVVL